MKHQHAFSLIELIIVLTIIAIIAVFSFPTLSTYLSSAQANVVNAQLLRTIHLARNEAIARHEKIIICGSSDQKICSDHWQNGFIVLAKNQLIYAFRSPASNSQLYWRSFPFNRQQLEFLPSGFPNAQNGTFWFCTHKISQPTWAIMLSQSGRARVLYPDSNGTILDDRGLRLCCNA